MQTPESFLIAGIPHSYAEQVNRSERAPCLFTLHTIWSLLALQMSWVGALRGLAFGCMISASRSNNSLEIFAGL